MFLRHFAGKASVTVAFLSLASCSLVAPIVPKDGPTGEQVRSDAGVRIDQSPESLGYAFVALSPTVVNQISRCADPFVPKFHNLPPARLARAEPPISVGDVLSVTVFEASSGGLFIPNEAGARAGNFIQIPTQQVGASGRIEVPYVGNITVAGKAPHEVSQEIAHSLAHRAIEPQVVVAVSERKGYDVNILGEVNSPTRFYLEPNGIRLLGAIARAGGPKYPAHESLITLQRRGSTSQSLLSAVIKDPSQNVELAAGDSVFISREPKVFLAFGATQDLTAGSTAASRRFVFDADNVSLAEGLAKAGGLASARADPRSVFLLRFESRKVLSALGVDVSAYDREQVPTIYSVDLSKSDGFFLMDSIYLRHRDVIVASDSPTTDFMKLLALLNGLGTLAFDAGVAKQ